MKLDDFKDFVKNKYPNLLILNIDSDIKYRDRIKFKCDKHGLNNSRFDHFIKKGCSYCNKLLLQSENRDKFIYLSNKKHDNKYRYDKVIYINNKTDVIITCDKHGDFKQRPDNHIAGAGCTNCNYKLSNNDFIEKCREIHNNRYIYDKTLYNGYRSYITIKCKKHGYFNQLARIHINGFGCPKCSESLGETKIYNFLVERGVSFERQKKFDDCKNINNLKFDFFLPKYNMCIEYNGLQHYTPIDFFGGEESYKLQLKLDKIKLEYCNANNIKLLIISYKDDIISILEDIFSKKSQF